MWQERYLKLLFNKLTLKAVLTWLTSKYRVDEVKKINTLNIQYSPLCSPYG